MRNTFSNRMHAIAATLTLAGAVLACDGGNTQQGQGRATAAPVAQPVAVVPVSDVSTIDTTPAVPTVPADVTYSDAEAVYQAGRFADASEMFAVYTASHPQNGWGHYMLGLSAWKAGDPERAIVAFERTVELDSANVKARTNLGRVLLEQGRANDALGHLEVARTLEPRSAAVLRVTGNALSEIGRPEESLAAYREALAIDPEDAWSMNNYALQLIRLGRFEDALAPLARAVELKPGSALFQNNLGVALERSGDLASAAASYEAALVADESHERARVSLDRVRQHLTGDEVATTDLGALAILFLSEVESWRMPTMEAVGVR